MPFPHGSLVSSSEEPASFDSTYLNEFDSMCDEDDPTTAFLFNTYTNGNLYESDESSNQEHLDPQQDAVTTHASDLMDGLLADKAPLWGLGDLGENGSSNFQMQYYANFQPNTTPPELCSGAESTSSNESRLLTPPTPPAEIPPTPKILPVQSPVPGADTQVMAFLTPLPSPVMNNNEPGSLELSQPFTENDHLALLLQQTTVYPTHLGTTPAPPSSSMQAYPDPLNLARMIPMTPSNSASPPQFVQQVAAAAFAVPPVALPETLPAGPMVPPRAAPAKPPQEPVSNNCTFVFAENIVPKNFIANPNNHGRWEFDTAGNRHYLNAPKAKKWRSTK